MVAAVAMSISAFADELYSLVNNGVGGNSYILINQNLDSFSFDVLKYENAALNGHAGYFVYSEDLSGQALENYVKANGVDIAKNQTTVNVGELKEGDKVGFYKWEKTGGFLGTIKKTYDTEFMLGTKVVSRSTDWHGNVTETVLDTGTFVDYISGSSRRLDEDRDLGDARLDDPDWRPASWRAGGPPHRRARRRLHEAPQAPRVIAAKALAVDGNNRVNRGRERSRAPVFRFFATLYHPVDLQKSFRFLIEIFSFQGLINHT